MTCCCHREVTRPPQEFPAARESDPESLPMWLFWTYVALLVGLVVANIWTALT